MLENGGYSSTTLKTFQHIQRRRHVTGFSSPTKHLFTWFLPYRALNVSSDSRPDYIWAELPVSHSPTHTSNSFHLTHSLNIQRWGATRSPVNAPSPHLFSLFTPDLHKVAEHRRIFHVAEAEKQSPCWISVAFLSDLAGLFFSFRRRVPLIWQIFWLGLWNFISAAVIRLLWSDLCRTHTEAQKASAH